MLASVTETIWDCFWAEPVGKLACREAMVLFLMENKSFFKLVTGKADFKHARGKEGQHGTFLLRCLLQSLKLFGIVSGLSLLVSLHVEKP